MVQEGFLAESCMEVSLILSQRLGSTTVIGREGKATASWRLAGGPKEKRMLSSVRFKKDMRIMNQCSEYKPEKVQPGCEEEDCVFEFTAKPVET